MMDGRVCIVPSRVDCTGPYGVLGVRWLQRLRVTVNGRPVENVLGYDEAEGVVLVEANRVGELNRPTIIHGKVRAEPRA